jgi:hypothetical protein
VEATFANVCWWQLSVAVRILRFVFIEEALLIIILHVQGLLFTGSLAVLLRNHWHLARVRFHVLRVWVIVDCWLHWLLIVLATIITVQVIALNVYH